MSHPINETFLTTVASTGVAFVGFASLIGTFRKGSDQGLSPAETAGLRLIVAHSLAAVFVGLLPLCLASFHLSHDAAIRITCWFAAAFFLHQASAVILQLRAGVRPRRPRMLIWTFIPPTCVLCLMAIVTAASGAWTWTYSLSLYWLLFASSVQFLHFVVPPRD